MKVGLVDGGEQTGRAFGVQGSRACEPPWGPSRVAGGLLGVMGGEADGWGSAADAIDSLAPVSQGPVAGALVAIARDYIYRAGDGVPAEVARCHEGATAPGWLLTVAVVRPGQADLVADTLELATSAGVPRRSLGACVAYVELAAALFAAKPVERAVQAAAGGMASVDLLAVADPARAAPPLCGDSTADALSAGVWALLQDTGSAEVMAVVRRMSTPSVAAAVAGLIGLRDGCGALPYRWHQGEDCAAVCNGLAPGLVRSRRHGSARANGGIGRAFGSGVATPDHNMTSAGTAESVAEPVERDGSVEPPDTTTSAGWFRPKDRALKPAVLVRADVGVVADDHVDVAVSACAITEETEAIEEQSPANAEMGVEEPNETPADEWVGRTTPRRQLEGAAVR